MYKGPKVLSTVIHNTLHVIFHQQLVGLELLLIMGSEVGMLIMGSEVSTRGILCSIVHRST